PRRLKGPCEVRLAGVGENAVDLPRVATIIAEPAVTERTTVGGAEVRQVVGVIGDLVVVLVGIQEPLVILERLTLERRHAVLFHEIVQRASHATEYATARSSACSSSAGAG